MNGIVRTFAEQIPDNGREITIVDWPVSFTGFYHKNPNGDHIITKMEGNATLEIANDWVYWCYSEEFKE